MEKIFWPAVGALAAALTMFSFVPQIIKVVKIRSAKSISPLTLFQLSCGVFLWIIYGIYLKDAIIIIANVVTLTSLIILLCLYFRYGKEQ
jgi:MtN3 and saliva related transmembrane protein